MLTFLIHPLYHDHWMKSLLGSKEMEQFHFYHSFLVEVIRRQLNHQKCHLPPLISRLHLKKKIQKTDLIEEASVKLQQNLNWHLQLPIFNSFQILFFVACLCLRNVSVLCVTIILQSKGLFLRSESASTYLSFHLDPRLLPLEFCRSLRECRLSAREQIRVVFVQTK